MTTAPIAGYRRSVLARSLALALTLPMAFSAVAQDTQEEDEEEAAASSRTTQLDTVEVVGSRIKRAEVEGPSPVIVISRDDFEREGFKTVGDALQTLTQNSTASFTGDLGVTGFTPNAQVVNLRSLGPQYTLTLINGRRPAQYPQPYNRDNNVVNLRAIPSSIVERVEILTGGASAIYGSDAISGVVNVVLRQNYDGQLARLQVGTTDEGGGDSAVFEFSGGASGDRWSATYAFQAGYQEPVFASQREITADTRNGPLGAATVPGLALFVGRFDTTAGVPRQAIYYPGQAVCDQFGYTTVTTPARGTYCGGFTQPGARTISNKNEFMSAYGYATFDINDNLRVFGAVNLYDSQAASSSGTEFWSTSGDQFLLTPTGGRVNGYYDSEFGQFTFLQRVFNPFELGGAEAATTLFDEFTYDVSAGVAGMFGERFDWEANVAYSKYDYTADRPRLLSQAMHDYFLGPLLGYQAAPITGVLYPVYNLNEARWNAPITPEFYRSVSTRAVNEGDAESTTANFVVTGDLFEMPAGAVGFAGVLEWGRQAVDLRSDPRTLPTRPIDGQTIYNLTSSGRTVGERDRYALGAEFRIPLLESLTANLAARYDKYDDITEVDDAVTTMASLEWRPLERLLLRANYSTSFRAPDMQLVYAEGAGSFSGILDQYACRAGVGVAAGQGPRTLTQCNVPGDPTVYTAQTLIAGNPLLKEEEGTSWGAGFVWDIIDGMSLSVDYYRIELEDQAIQLSAAFLLSNEANCRLGVRTNGQPFEFASDSAFCQNVYNLVVRQAGTTDGSILRLNQAYINAALTDTSGIDATWRYTWDTDRLGRFGIDLGWSLQLTDRFKQFDSDPLIDFRDALDLDARSRARGSVSWSKGDWSTTVFGSRIGTNTNAQGNARLQPYMVYNWQVGKRFGENTSATFTIVNVLNNQYREDPTARGYPFYQPFIGADPLGRRFNLSIQHRF